MKKYCKELQQKFAELDFSIIAFNDFIANGINESNIVEASQMKKEAGKVLEYLQEFLAFWRKSTAEAWAFAMATSMKTGYRTEKGNKGVATGGDPFFRAYIEMDYENHKVVVKSKVHESHERYNIDLSQALESHHTMPSDMIIKTNVTIWVDKMGVDDINNLPEDIIIGGDFKIYNDLPHRDKVKKVLDSLISKGQIKGEVIFMS